MSRPAAASRLADPQQLGDLVLFRLSRLAATAGAQVVRLCEGRFGVTRREWRLVALLAESGPLSPSQLALHAQLDRARTSRTLSTLIAKGLVRRTVQARDQRYAEVSLTDQGSTLHAQLFPGVAAINRQLLADLQPQEAAALEDLLERLQRRADGGQS